MIIFGIDIKIYFLLFITYAIVGWCMEVTCKLIQYKRFINRGFLIGPYCPIYGYGAILITFLLERYTSDPFVLFIMSILVCGTLEYLTSYFMEKIYHTRWWDYSNKKFNINGRVCLNTIIPFGILGLFIMYVSNPFLINFISGFSGSTINILFWTIFTIFITDNIVSGVVNNYIKTTIGNVSKNVDSTEEITSKVREILLSKSIFHRRLINAYPKLQTIKTKIKEKNREIKAEIKKQVSEIKEQIEKKENGIKEKIEKISEDEKPSLP